MKRKQFISYIESKGCELIREGHRHSWWWNPKLNKRSSVPRHSEVDDLLAKKICRDLGISPLK